jgi:hypothetical protein
MRLLTSKVIVLALVVAALLAWASPATSSTRPTRDNNCVHPFSGVSLNELFGVPEQFVGPVCPGLTAGEHWRPIQGWFAAETEDAVYPPGYTPQLADPILDALAKLTIKMVIDGGTAQEKTYLFTPEEAVALVRIHQLNPAFPDMPGFFLLPRMDPLSPGHHTQEMILVFSAQHCDGVSTDESVSCLPAGETSAWVRPADVAIPEPVN